ncbi:sulfatase [Halosimplex amylolyticum]|uniref:sulfatase n=1 Tax=Halosimplex amylolyticum TaxID=3396616 RepID=UPI003F565136
MSQNVILVTIDSLRADHCGFMGYDRDTTPTLDAMADDGMVFKNAIAPGPRTPESLPAMFTGRYPDYEGEDGDTTNNTQDRIQRLLSSSVSIPERFKSMGYETAAFTPNPWTSRYFGFDQGFDHFEDFMSDDRSQSIWERMVRGGGSTALVATRLLLSWLQRENTFKPWRSFADDIERWATQADEPYFLWIFLLDVHFPYLPESEYRTQSRWRTYEANLRLYAEPQDEPYSSRVHDQLVTGYDDAICYTDNCLRWLKDHLGGSNTSFVVTADHGEGFGDHGTYGHHDQLYQENIHVPFVVTGGPSASIESPLTLRKLPRLLTSVAREEWNAVENSVEPIVGTKTTDESIEAVRGTDWKYIDKGGDGELYTITGNTETQIDDTDLRSDAADTLAGWRERNAERDRVETATNQAVKETEI